MATPLTPLDPAELPMLAAAAAVGFPRLSYTFDVLDGEIDPPDAMFAVGFGLDYMQAFFPRLRHDPLRRKIATGEVAVGATPVSFVNTGTEVVVEGCRLPGETSLLRWCLSEGVRTGVSFRIPLDQGRCGSVNFYSPGAWDDDALESVLPTLFLAGHRAHTRLAARRAPSRGLLLSRREIECLQALARGGSNGQIALELGLSIDTVKEYVQGLLRKLRACNRAQAVSRGHVLNYL